MFFDKKSTELAIFWAWSIHENIHFPMKNLANIVWSAKVNDFIFKYTKGWGI